MEQPIQNGIGQSGVSDPVVPFVKRDLGGDDRRAEIVPVLHDLEQILPLFRSQGRKTKILQNKKVLFGQILEEPEQLSRASGNVERLEEPGEAQEEDPISQTAGQCRRFEPYSAPPLRLVEIPRLQAKGKFV